MFICIDIFMKTDKQKILSVSVMHESPCMFVLIYVARHARVIDVCVAYICRDISMSLYVYRYTYI